MNIESFPGYQTAIQQASCFLHPGGSLIQIAGPDRVAFVQRQTTNDAHQLEAGRLQLSVLTNPTARILDVFHILPEAEWLTLLTLPGRGPVTTGYLKRRIFFMDKVTITDLSAAYDQIELIGPQVTDGLARLGVQTLPSNLGVISARIGEVETHLLATSRAISFGYRLLAPADATQVVLATLLAAGFSQLDAVTFDLLRIEAGLPAVDRELSEEYTPLEVRLIEAISDSKGCYTGQEIIARQITYDKVTQQLCGVHFSQPITGNRVWVDGKAAGEVTSTAHSPRLGPIGLAIIKRPNHQPGTVLMVGNAPEAAQTAEVVALPFI